jgi:hypothetical protein
MNNKIEFTSIFIFLMITSIVASQNKSFIQTDKALTDIDYMINTIEEIHYNPYFKIKKELFFQYKDELLNDFNKDSISYRQFLATGMKLVAQMSGGHTTMDWQNNEIIQELIQYNFIPFTGLPANDNKCLVITRSYDNRFESGILIESINGIPIIDLYKECMTYNGGIDSFKKIKTEQAFPIYLFFTDKLSPPYYIKLYNKDNEIETSGLKVSELNEFLTQTQTNESYIFEIVNDNIGLITYNQCEDYMAFEEFLKSTFMTIKIKGINNVIIDIRKNTGGDSKLNDLLLSYITKKPYRQSSRRYWKVSKHSKDAYRKNSYENYFGEKFMEIYYKSDYGSVIESLEEKLIYPKTPNNYFSGKTCFLIGPSTFSSANFLADAVKTYSISSLIGSSTGELTNDFGEVISFTLPNSGNFIYVSSTYDIGANGNLNFFEPVHPDIQTKEDALIYAIKWIK